MSHPIETINLVKQYGPVTAVDGVSLRVTQGEIYAFLGLNGAGKTTTIRMLLGMIKPSSGQSRLLGHPIRTGGNQPWHNVGYLVETPHAYPELTVRENLEVIRRLRPGVPPEAVGQIIEQLDLISYADRRSGTLSLGNAQRLGLAKALLHRPELLILDEPANGLDPVGIVKIRKLLRELSRVRGVTIFMSSHLLSEVSRLADRIGIIHQGRLLQELTVAGLEQQRQRRLLIRGRDSQAILAVLGAAGLTAELDSEGLIVLREPQAIDRPEEIATLLVEQGQPPTHLTVTREDLEHYFLRLIRIYEGEAA